jgi:predicted permease
MMDSLIRDVKFGARVLWKDRGFAATAILTLAICIGANTAIFTIVNSVLLSPLPVPDSDQILLVSNQYPNAGVGNSRNSGVPDYYDRLRDVNGFDEQAVFQTQGRTLEIDGTPQRVRGMSATPSLFRLLRVPAEIGRTFTEEDGEVGKDQKIILSHGLWQDLFGGSPSALEDEIRLSGRPYTVVGVMPADFLFVDPEVRFWTPVAFTVEDRSDTNRHSNSWTNVGRLKSGTSIEQVRSQVDALNAANLERFPAFREPLINAGFYTSIEPLQEMLVRDVRSNLYLLWGGAFFVLLIGAVNIANLTLARSGLRLKELATRLALGAGRGQVARQLITESVIVTLLGGIAGLAFGSSILTAFGVVGLDQIPRAGEIQITGTVVGFTMALAVVVGVLIGLVPVAYVFRANLNNVLHEESRSGSTGRGARAIRRGLVVAQVGFAFLLLIGAGLLLASFSELLQVDPGFRAEGVLTATVSPPSVRYESGTELTAFTKRTLDSIRAIPGVQGAGSISNIPFDGTSSDSVILAEDYVMRPGESLISPRRLVATPGYFEAMGIDLIRGRLFGPEDTEDGTQAVIVDERLANKFWTGQDPIGRRMYRPSDAADMLKIDENTEWLSVVGVVDEVRFDDLSGDRNQAGAYYFPYAQNPSRTVNLVVRTAMDPAAMTETLRAEVARIDPQLPLFDIRTMRDRVDLSLLPRRGSMLLAIGFAIIALLLSAIGIYGVLAYLVTQRTKEIGIRIALGSSAQRVFSIVLREGVLLVAIGLGLGLGGMPALRQAMQAQIYGIDATDPTVIGIVVATLGIVAVTACLLPARRATQVDPIITLNEQ